MKDPAESLIISLVQTPLYWEDKQANLDMLQGRIAEISEKTEIAILPEMFSTGFSMKPSLLAETMDGPSVAWMKKIAAQKKIILTGSLIIEEEGQYFNRLIWMLPTGDLGYYDKRHLFGFAGEDKRYTGGNKRLIASVKGWKINLQVCYDLRFPVWARQNNPLKSVEQADRFSSPEYDLLIYVANWPEKRIHAWKTLLQARAIENQCYVAGVNRTGIDGEKLQYSGDSMIVDPLGEIVLQCGAENNAFTFALQRDRLEEVRNRFPFLKDADNFLIGN